MNIKLRFLCLLLLVCFPVIAAAQTIASTQESNKDSSTIKPAAAPVSEIEEVKRQLSEQQKEIEQLRVMLLQQAQIIEKLQNNPVQTAQLPAVSTNASSETTATQDTSRIAFEQGRRTNEKIIRIHRQKSAWQSRFQRRTQDAV